MTAFKDQRLRSFAGPLQPLTKGIRLHVQGIGLLILAILSAALPGAAQVPGIINYQGRLTVSGTNYSGTYQFKFALVNAAGDTAYWCHNGSSSGGGQPSGAAIALPVNNGLFTVNLGDVTVSNMASSIPASVFTNSQVYLRLWASDPATGSTALISPDQRINAVGYAMVAASLLGPVSDSQLPSGLARLGASQTFTGSNSFANSMSVSGTVSAAAVAGDGSRLTNLNAANLLGPVSDSQLPSGLARLGASQTFTGSNVFAGSMTVIGTLSAAALAGDGSKLTNLNIGQAAAPSGTLLVSATAQDVSLLAQGYLPTMSVPAPAWVDGGDSADAPGPRTGQSGIWDGQQFIIWGGSLGPSTPWVNSGGCYRPDLDGWNPVSLLNAPDARAGHSAVWSGTQMLVWGGVGASGYLNSGGLYQSSAQAWTPMMGAGAPAPRSSHAALWTGTRMVVWGGQNSSGVLGDGALYDAAADQWSALGLANPPAARAGPAAVWAGDRLLVWGGEGANGELNTGAQLVCTNGVPARWVAMTQANAPAARRWHTGVWTGQKLLVWGGSSGGVALGDGAAYDPAADSWAAMPQANAPAARFNHAALWTGQEMLIVGGSTGSGELVSGSAYNPATGQWRTLSNSGTPLARAGATALWSGVEALVFGGQAGGVPLASLQRLNPQPAWYFYRKP